MLVPAYNEAGGLGGCLAAIREASRAWHARGWTSELIVCDNNSTDTTAEVARAAGATVVFEPINQIARARNAAAAAATGDWFVFIDADCAPTAALFADVADAIASGRTLAGGSTVTMDVPWIPWLGMQSWNVTSRLMRWAAGSFIFVDARAFRAVGGFDTALYAAEEIALSRRLKGLARREGRRMTILRRHPLHTSARKLHLYSWREGLRFMLRTVLTGGRSLTRREDCFVWYDGRR